MLVTLKSHKMPNHIYQHQKLSNSYVGYKKRHGQKKMHPANSTKKVSSCSRFASVCDRALFVLQCFGFVFFWCVLTSLINADSILDRSCFCCKRRENYRWTQKVKQETVHFKRRVQCLACAWQLSSRNWSNLGNFDSIPVDQEEENIARG